MGRPPPDARPGPAPTGTPAPLNVEIIEVASTEGGGIDVGGLLDHVAHRHWFAMAASAGVSLEDMADVNGKRVVPAIIACTLEGRTSAFAPGSVAQLTTLTPPTAATGWCSLSMMENDQGARLQIELASAFVVPNVTPGTLFHMAVVPHHLRAHRQGSESRRWRELRRRSVAALAMAQATPSPVMAERELHAAWSFAGRSLASLGQLVTVLDEAAELAVHVPGAALVRREAFLFAGVDDGEALALASEIALPMTAAGGAVASELTTLDVARRHADGTVVAIGHSRFEAP